MTVRALLQRFWALCLLRAAPQELPAARVLTHLTLAAYLASGLTLMLIDTGLLSALSQLLLDAGMLALTTGFLLALRGHPRRLGQTLSALFGSGALLNLLAIPITLGLVSAHQAGAGNPLFALLWLGLIAWSLTVSGHIYRHALDLPLPGGILVALGYMVLIIALTRSMVGG